MHRRVNFCIDDKAVHKRSGKKKSKGIKDFQSNYNRDGIMAFKTDLSKHFHLKDFKSCNTFLVLRQGDQTRVFIFH
jgi:hypothetical protein